VVARVDRLANVVKQGREQKFLVETTLIARQLKDLKAVIESVASGWYLALCFTPSRGWSSIR